MDPEMMKIAMEQMKNMTPEQMAQMQEQVKNLSPETMQAAMDQMRKANPEDVKRQMKNATLNPDELKRNMDNFDAQTKAQSTYKFDASAKLKAEGNAFFSSGKYAEASAKYVKAIENLGGLANQEAKKLLQTCYLNNAACCLHLQKYDECIKHCSQVMKTKKTNTDSGNFKGLYRRGQAYLHTSKYKEAVADLNAALALNSKDESLVELLKKAEESLAEYEVSKPTVEDLPLDKENESGDKGKEEEEGTVEEVTEEQGQGGGLEGPPDMDKVREMMDKDPSLCSKMAEQMRNLSDEEMIAALEAGGGDTSNMTPEMIRMTKESFVNMSDDQLMVVMGMRDQTADGQTNEDFMEQMTKTMQQNPSMMQSATQMMSNMSEAELMHMAEMSGGMPGGEKIDTEQMKKALGAMKDLKPEELESLTKLAMETQGGKAGKAETLQKGAEALGQMSTDTVTSVASSMGYELSEVQAEMMTKIVRFVARILKLLITVKDFIIGKWFFALALLVVLVSLYMRSRE
jgi:tetratricopeptide (TPR) repeat protein